MVTESPDEEQLRKSMPQLVEFLSKLAARSITRTEREELFTLLSTILKRASKMPKVDYSKLPHRERKRAASNLLNDLLQVFSPEIHVKNPVDWLADSLYKPLADPPTDSYLSKTKFTQYRNALFEIVETVYAQKKHNAIDAIFADMPEDDFFALFQSIPKLEKELGYLNRKKDRVTKKVVERYFAIYQKISTFFEKMALQFFGISRLLEGVDAKYTPLSKSKLSDYVNSLSKKPYFSEIVQPMNVTIRNSIAHDRTVIEPITRKIKFTDKRESASMTYEGFVQTTRELAAATYVMSHFDNAMKLYIIVQIKNLAE